MGIERHVHVIGAGGIGISAVAKWLLAQGAVVTGSDSKESAITNDLAQCGAHIVIGHAAKNVPAMCDLVVYTEAAQEDNPERVEAARRGIRQLGHFGFLAELAQSMRTICVTGTNGKSTTTAMMGKIFEAAGFDPTVFVGSIVPGWELGNVRIGKSDILIVEGDEYKRKVLALQPETTVITNIEEDHLDVYKDLDDIIGMFQQVVTHTSGTVFVNANDAASQRLAGARIVTYSARDVANIAIGVPGEFNKANAAAACAVATAYGISREVIRAALAAYRGIWRRFERVGDFLVPQLTAHSPQLVPVISDYGHHPTAVAGTLAAAKEFFPGARIVLAFQPHQHNRTKELFDEFVKSFDGADVLILAEVYEVEGRTAARDRVSSSDLLAAVATYRARKGNDTQERWYAKNLDDVETRIRSVVKEGDVVLVMGAGDIDAVARRLVAEE